jgi:hypothetical protein
VDEHGDSVERDPHARVADDRTGADETAHDETAHDETAHDETGHDETGHDETGHDETGRGDHEEHAVHTEPPAVMVTPLGPAQIVAEPGKLNDKDEPAADLDHDGATAETAETADETPTEAATELKPGDVPVAAVTPFLGTDAIDDLRQRWREAQLGFVDDPRQASEDVRALVGEAIDKVVAALQSQRDEIGASSGSDTEQYRVTVQRSRAFFDRLLNL